MAHECLGCSPQSSNSSTSGLVCTVTTTASTVSDTTTAVNAAAEIAPDDSVSNAPAACVVKITNKLTHAQQIAKLEEEMSDDEQGTYLDSRDMESDFYSAEL